jgi:hypothetical protein
MKAACPANWRSPVTTQLEVLFNKICHPGIEVERRVSTGYAMVFVWVEQHLELFVGLYQRSHKIDAVLKMDVVVACSVHKQEFAHQLFCKVDG